MSPPSYKLVYKPHEYYSYRYHKPYSEMGVIKQFSYRKRGGHIVGMHRRYRNEPAKYLNVHVFSWQNQWMWVP